MNAVPPSRPAGDPATGAPALDLTFRRQGGRTRLAEQLVRYPFHITRPFYFDRESAPGLATLYLQSASGGYYRGERLPVRIRACEGAELSVTTQASTIVHHARGTPTVAETLIEAEAGSVVFHAPDPLILLPGAELSTSVRVRRASDATVLVSEAFMIHDPEGADRPFGRLENEIRIETPDGSPEPIDRLEFVGSDLSIVSRLDGVLASAGVMIAGPQAADADPVEMEASIGAIEGARVAACRLPFGTGLSVRIAASSGVALSAVLDAVFAAAFRLVYDGEPGRRRK